MYLAISALLHGRHAGDVVNVFMGGTTFPRHFQGEEPHDCHVHGAGHILVLSRGLAA